MSKQSLGPYGIIPAALSPTLLRKLDKPHGVLVQICLLQEGWTDDGAL